MVSDRPPFATTTPTAPTSACAWRRLKITLLALRALVLKRSWRCAVAPRASLRRSGAEGSRPLGADKRESLPPPRIEKVWTGG